jgi:hypothetical protein
MSAKPQRPPLSRHADLSPGSGNHIPDGITWRLQVRFAGGIQETSFRSRHEAIEQARALIGDYGHTVSITLVSPQGITEALQGFPFVRRRGTC